MSARQEIINEIHDKIKMYVVNQARYIYPSKMVDDELNDSMYAYADTEMTDEQTEKFLVGKNIISRPVLFELVSKIGVRDLYNSNCIDDIADHIILHKEDCNELWQFIKDNMD